MAIEDYVTTKSLVTAEADFVPIKPMNIPSRASVSGEMLDVSNSSDPTSDISSPVKKTDPVSRFDIAVYSVGFFICSLVEASHQGHEGQTESPRQYHERRTWSEI